MLMRIDNGQKIKKRKHSHERRGTFFNIGQVVRVDKVAFRKVRRLEKYHMILYL